MRLVLPLLSFLVFTATCAAQVTETPAPPAASVKPTSDWNTVERLDPGTEVHIRYTGVRGGYIGTLTHTRHAHVVCDFVAATDEEISCVKSQRVLFVPIHTNLRVPRTQVSSIRKGRTAVSAFVGGLIGVGAGLAAAAITIAASGESDHSEDGLVYTIFAGLGSIIGSSIGRHIDFTGGPVIYTAP